MSDTNISFFKKPMSIKAFWFLFILIFVGFNILGVLNCFDTDMFFMVSTGDYIIDNGIPHQHMWSIDRSSGFVAQQWLYAVILSALLKLGPLFIYLFMALQLTLFYFVVYKFCRIKGMSWPATALCLALVCVFNRYYGFNIRPQTITLILLFIECIALEKYKITHKILYLFVLPLVIIAEMNLHMSMWFVHFLVLFAYFCPAFYFKGAVSDHLFKEKKAVACTAIAMTVALFVNPYGIEGITYLFKSFTSGAFDYFEDIIEMQHPDIISANGFVCAFILVFLGILIKLKSIRSVTMNVALGFSVMMMMVTRNIMYLSIVTVYIMSDIYDYIVQSNKVINWKKDITRALYVISIPVILFMGVSVVNSSIKHVNNGIACNAPDYDAMCAIGQYLDEHANKDTHIMTTFSTGGYLEYIGYNNIYIDARPELYTAKFTGGKNIARDYNGYAETGMLVDVDIIKKNFTGVNMKVITNDEMQAWLDYYDFKYFFVDGTVPYLTGYLSASSDYELIELGTDTRGFMLYHRISERGSE